MRYVAYGDLRTLIETEGRLSAGRTVAIAGQVASALDAAHAQGLVHRDVKPGNVLLDATGGSGTDHVYLSDFGLSKDALATTTLTAAGQFMGTLDYVSPEQIQGHTADGRADQYALACVAFQLLTGQVPFERDQGMAILLAHLSEPPPSLVARRPDLPVAADMVLARALAKVPEKRFGSCGEFAEALRAALGLARYDPRGTAPVPAAAPDHPPTVIAAPPPEPADHPAEPADPPAEPADPPAEPADVRADLAAPVTMDSRSGGPPAVADARTADRPLPTIPATRRQATSPRRRRQMLAIALAGAVLAAAAITGTLLASAPKAGPPKPRPSSSVISPATVSAIKPIATLAARTLAATFTDPGSSGVSSVAFSPDGATLAAADRNGKIFLWNVAARTLAATFTDPRSSVASSVAFSPDGATLAAGDRNGSTFLWNVAARTLAATFTDPRSSGVSSVAFSPDGATLAAGDGNGRIFLWHIS
jgi:serine/threonine-protein kinase